MRRHVLGLTAALFVAGCAPQTIIANKQQAVIQAWSHGDAVQLARQECGRFERWPLLQRHDGSDYWFVCNESDEAIEARQNEARRAMLARVEPTGTAPASKPPAAPAVAPTAPVPVTGTAQEAAVAPPAPPKERTASARTAPASGSAGKAEKAGSWVHLGAFRDKTIAERYVAEIRKAHAGIIGSHGIVLREAALGSRGTLLVARLGPYSGSAEAREACGTLKARGTSCFVPAAR